MHPLFFSASETATGISIQPTAFATWGLVGFGMVLLLACILIVKQADGDGAGLPGSVGSILRQAVLSLIPIVGRLLINPVIAEFALRFRLLGGLVLLGLGTLCYGLFWPKPTRILDQDGLKVQRGSEHRVFTWSDLHSVIGNVNSMRFKLRFVDGDVSDEIDVHQLITGEKLQDKAIALVKPKLAGRQVTGHFFTTW